MRLLLLLGRDGSRRQAARREVGAGDEEGASSNVRRRLVPQPHAPEIEADLQALVASRSAAAAAVATAASATAAATAAAAVVAATAATAPSAAAAAAAAAAGTAAAGPYAAGGGEVARVGATGADCTGHVVPGARPLCPGHILLFGHVKILILSLLSNRFLYKVGRPGWPRKWKGGKHAAQHQDQPGEQGGQGEADCAFRRRGRRGSTEARTGARTPLLGRVSILEVHIHMYGRPPRSLLARL